VKIVIYGPHPDMPTGYAAVIRELIPQLRMRGHEVAISATSGQDSRPGWWNGVPVLPCTPYAEIGEDTIRPNYTDFGGDVVFTFLCTWILAYPQVWRDLRTVHVTAVDCDPMSYADWEVINATYGTPAAISRFGVKMMRAGRNDQGLDPLYLPNAVNTRVFVPSPDRDAIRAEMGVTGKFVVGANFMNNDRLRKNTDPLFRGFARFHADYPDSVLAVHAIQALPEGIHLPRLAAHLGISDAVMWSPQPELVRGMITPPMLADWYSSLDVLADIGNEGFGMCSVEAQACGTPVIRGSWAAGPELAGPGWLVEGQGQWNDKHRASWGLAFVSSVAGKLAEAYEGAGKLRDDARSFAVEYEISRVVTQHWEPVLADLEEG
jgi:glycosyltransferase involved in cell wall biosynthesis